MSSTPSDASSNAPPTCGQGLAEHSRVPAKLGTLMAAVADLLEHHTTALDPGDALARRELDAYRRLVVRHREFADALEATAAEMAGYRDLPMAPHDMGVMMHPDSRRLFASVVQAEDELSGLLRHRLDRDREMLRQMP